MKGFLKETGKYLYDISKIILGLAVITPIVKDESVSVVAIAVAISIFAVGAFMVYKGGSDDS